MPNVLPNPNRLPQSIQQDLSKILYQHDPSGQMLLDFFPYAKVFRYNTNDLIWEANPLIEGSCLAYTRQNEDNSLTDAFMVIQAAQHWIQIINATVSTQVEQSRLFYQTSFHGQAHIFMIQFHHAHEAMRVQQLIQHSVTKSRSEPMNMQQHQHQQRKIPTPVMKTYHNIHLPVGMPVASSPSPILSMNSNVHATDPTISLKQILKINEPEPESVPLLPPSAFVQPPPPPPPPGFPSIDREHVRRTLVHLIQTDDQFFDTIYQTYLYHQ